MYGRITAKRQVTFPANVLKVSWNRDRTAICCARDASRRSVWRRSETSFAADTAPSTWSASAKRHMIPRFGICPFVFFVVQIRV